MTRPIRYHALIPAAGTGSRFAAGLPKQYALLDGRPVLQHAMERLATGFRLHMTYVALAAEDRWYEQAIGVRDHVTPLRCGGRTRAETVRNALSAISDAMSGDWIVVHDAARPCVDASSLLRLQYELADDAVGGILAIPVVAALKRADADGRIARSESRADLWQAQTPQMFRYAVLRDALVRPGAEDALDEAQAVEALGARPRLIAGNSTNLKISYPDDLLLAAAILAAERGAKT